MKKLKGKICFYFDEIDYRHRWFHQRISSRSKMEINNEKTFHLMCINRDDYIIPTIKCANSWWQFHPEFQIIVWCDLERLEKLSANIRKFHRKDRIQFRIIDVRTTWQETKLEIICERMSTNGIFSDADMFYNGKIEIGNTPLFFLREFEFSEYSHTKRLIEILDLNRNKPWYMLNVSIVFLGNLAKSNEFLSRAYSLFHRISQISNDEFLGMRELTSLRRMSEQLSLSIAIQEFSEYEYLKNQDYVMDGGIAESYYLGSTRGY